jgi:hypothetical protein
MPIDFFRHLSLQTSHRFDATMRDKSDNDELIDAVLLHLQIQICIDEGTHSANRTSGLPFSTTYVASSAPLPLPMFFTEWIVPAGTNPRR